MRENTLGSFKISLSIRSMSLEELTLSGLPAEPNAAGSDATSNAIRHHTALHMHNTTSYRLEGGYRSTLQIGHAHT